ncbi:MAG: hypothetical protein KY455_09225 [Euryarchaeota archaeon]|nr:hypothetical protein [Euryarchaeota archaeon]
MSMRKPAVVLLIGLFLGIALLSPAEASEEGTSRKYVVGGAGFGTTRICNGDNTDFDIGGACHLPCGSDRVCEMSIWDDVNGNNVRFVPCVPGEGLCRFIAFKGSGSISNADFVTVVPFYDDATTGIVTVK